MKFGYLIDMDGVIYRENRLIPGAVEFVNALLSTGTPFLFLTNNSAPTAEDLTVRLRHLGVNGLSPKHFYTSAMNTADFLAETHPNCSVFAIGEGGLLTALHDYKIANDAIRPDYVVVGEGAATTEKLAKAHECIERGARLIATNPDNWCPVSEEKTRPGAGAIAAFLEASTGSRAYYLGKPNGYMFHRARRKLMESALNFSGPVAMIGDTMETDIRVQWRRGCSGFWCSPAPLNWRMSATTCISRVVFCRVWLTSPKRSSLARRLAISRPLSEHRAVPGGSRAIGTRPMCSRSISPVLARR